MAEVYSKPYLIPPEDRRWTSCKVSRRGPSYLTQGQDGTLERPRLAVYRSNNHIYAQVSCLLHLKKQILVVED